MTPKDRKPTVRTPLEPIPNAPLNESGTYASVPPMTVDAGPCTSDPGDTLTNSNSHSDPISEKRRALPLGYLQGCAPFLAHLSDRIVSA
jgi:hypothetical protein